MIPSEALAFVLGDRVLVSPEYHWAQSATGVISAPPPEIAELAGNWRHHVRYVPMRKGIAAFYWVVFDQPQRDADGDGPYNAGEIQVDALVSI